MNPDTIVSENELPDPPISDHTEFNKLIDNLEAQIRDIIDSCGSSREMSLAMTKFEEAAMWMRKAAERM